MTAKTRNSALQGPSGGPPGAGAFPGRTKPVGKRLVAGKAF